MKKTISTVSIIAGSLLVFQAHDVMAQAVQTPIERAIADANTTRFAFVKTGNKELDNISQSGLSGLSQFIGARTSLEPGFPRGVDPETDELSLYAFIYWPIDEDAETPSTETMARIDSFMKQGGTVIFDTRDQLAGGGIAGGNTAENQKLREILGSLNVPALQRVDGGHVLTRSFYLLQKFPGRFSGSPLWAESWRDGETGAGASRRLTDGVSSILITGNDFAGAWAVGTDGRYLLPTIPADPRQRELALRVGVNIAMYALTGNYKADQVHLPALMERLGQ